MLTFFKHGLASERLYYTLDGGERQSLSGAALGRFFWNFLIFEPTDPRFEAGRRRTEPGGPIRRPTAPRPFAGTGVSTQVRPLCVPAIITRTERQGQAPSLQGLIFHRDVIPSNRQTDEAPAFRCPPLSRTWKTDPSGWSPADRPTKLRFAGTPGFQNSRAKSIRPGARFLPPAKTLGRAKRRGAAVRPFRRFAGTAVSNLKALSSEHGE